MSKELLIGSMYFLVPLVVILFIVVLLKWYSAMEASRGLNNALTEREREYNNFVMKEYIKNLTKEKKDDYM